MCHFNYRNFNEVWNKTHTQTLACGCLILKSQSFLLTLKSRKEKQHALVYLIGIVDTQAGGDIEALDEASGNGDVAQVTALLDSGVDVNGQTSNGSHALNNAAVENQLEVMRLLLDHGANPNVQNSQGDTPLICATKFAGGQGPTVTMLVEAGTDLTTQDNKGKTALDYAKEKGQQEAVAALEKTSK